MRYAKKYPSDDSIMTCLEIAQKLKQRGDLMTGETLLQVTCYALTERDERLQHPRASHLQTALTSVN